LTEEKISGDYLHTNEHEVTAYAKILFEFCNAGQGSASTTGVTYGAFLYVPYSRTDT
jgi:hypothetical protein